MVSEDALIGAAAVIIAAIITCLLTRKNKETNISLPDSDDVEVYIKKRKHFQMKNFIKNFLKLVTLFAIIGVIVVSEVSEEMGIYIIIFGISLALICSYFRAKSN